MKIFFDYIVFRVFDYFNKNDESVAVEKTVNFLVLFQSSLILQIFMILNLFIRIEPQMFGVDQRITYYVGIPLALVLLGFNTLLCKRRLRDEALKSLYRKYNKMKYFLSIWVIFLSPIIYGAINGTLRFPFLEK